jgi:DNA-binding PadR family transcriptional regulator
MKHQTTINHALEIVDAIAKHKELPQYNIKNETKLSYRTILRLLKPLENSGFIQLARREASEKGGKDRKIYAITLPGLIVALKNLEEKNFDAVINKHGELLPLILGKWNYLKSAGLEQERRKAVIWVGNRILAEYPLGKATVRFATMSFWDYIFQLTNKVERVKWIRALREDPELKAWAIDEMKEWFIQGEEIHRINKASLKALESPEEPNWRQLEGELRFHYRKRMSQEEMLDLLKI